VIVAAGSGEVVTDRPERRIDILVGRDELVMTWSRYEPGECGPDPHVHQLHADCFYVLAGELEFTLGPDFETTVAAAGSFVAAPAGLVHTFRNASDARALFLNMHAPSGGFDTYMRGQAETFDTYDPPEGGGLPRSEAIACDPGGGRRIQLLGGELLFKLDSEQAGGHLAVDEMTLPAGFDGPPPHRHRRMVDNFFVLDGVLTVRLDDQTATLGPGDFASVPPGAVHTFRNASDAPVRLLNLFAPAGLERYLAEMAEAVGAGREITPAVMAEYASRYDFEPT
jgi:quercetin dioxygenase-like cupin family protein